MLRDFVRNLFDGKPISVGPPQKPEDSDLQSALEDIQAFEKDWQLELPGEPPAFSPDAALWSVCSLYVASSYLVHRDAEVQLHEDLLGTPPPDRAQIESHYSVDLTMRFLPDLLRLARTAAPEDPLVKHMLDWARTWPLSSVGVKDLGAVDATPLRTSATLMRLYLDRILASGDTKRLDFSEINHLAVDRLGDYPNLPKNGNPFQESNSPEPTNPQHE